MIADDASQVNDDDLFPMLNFIGYSASPDDIKWPKKVLCGDPYQWPPNFGSQRPVPYYYFKRLSVLELMAS